MDSQGLSASTASTAARAAPSAAKTVSNAVRSTPLRTSGNALSKAKTTNELRSAAGSVGTLNDPKPTSRAMRILSGIQSMGNKVWMVGWVQTRWCPLPLPAAAAIGGLAGWVGLKSLQSAIKMPVDGIEKVLHDVKLNNIHKAPSTFLRTASEVAENGGSKYTQKLAKPLENAATYVEGHMDTVAGKVSETVAPARAWVSRGIENFGASSVGKGIDKRLQSVLDGRLATHQAKQFARLEAVETAFGKTSPGVWQKITRSVRNGLSSVNSNWFSKPAAADWGHLSTALGHVQATHGLTGEARIGGIKNAIAELETVMANKSVASEVASHASGLKNQLAKAMSSTEKVLHYGATNNQGVASFIKNTMQRVGKTNLFTAAIATAVVAGAGVALINAHDEKNAELKALEEFIADVGKDSPLAKIAAQTHHRNNHGRLASAAATTGADAMMVGGTNMMMPAIAAQVVASSMGSVLVSGTSLLAAYTALKASEAPGAEPLKPEDKLNLVRQMIAQHPSVAPNGGGYNRLVAPTSQLILDQHLTASGIAKLLGDDKAFTALASQALAAQKQVTTEAVKAVGAETLAADVPAPDAKTATAETTVAATAKTPAETAYLAAEKPASPAGNIAHKGTVAGQQHHAMMA